ncbi:hypothetical protein [Halobaculum litoreum]|uniref:MFS transporter n=1 Tax=Halobaculum litoreum TaxID=3031998 RepID=A0ABD5XT65_9EURY|nr:hypothetical protein [Halobaculum sp. DT92]
MSRDLWVVAAAVVLSVAAVPAALSVLLPALARDGLAARPVGVGVVAMAPGFLMGAVGLWLCARG